MPTEINEYNPSEEIALSSLIINEVDSNETFEKMKDKGLLQDNQLYLVTDGGTDTITPESIGAAPASHASDTTIHVTAEEKAAWNAKADVPFKPAGKSYLTFSSPNSFTLAVGDATKHWDGTLEYFASDRTWTAWDGTTTLSSVKNDGEYVLYLRGTGNTIITGSKSNYKWVLTGSNIKCFGNIENLLDYSTVEGGNHPTMASRCYSSMFYGCTSLTQIPAFPATTLADYCYSYMFQGCTSLKLSSTKTGEYTQEYRIPSSGTGTTASGALTKMFTSTGGTFTGEPSIDTTYYLSSDNMVIRETEIATLNGYVGSMIDAATPKSVTVTLAAASWDSTAKTQTVTVIGVSATETAQMITPTPVLSSQTAYYDAGILCTGQATDSLTFTCKTVPTADLTVYVVIQEVGA